MDMRQNLQQNDFIHLTNLSLDKKISGFFAD